jgi:simple sugar transport system ATP-binding protein
VPEDRLGMGLVGSMDLTDNMMLRSSAPAAAFSPTARRPKKLAEKVVDELEVVTPGVSTPVRKLSGGNVQKVLVGREIAMNAHRADDRLRRARPGHQHLLYHL